MSEEFRLLFKAELDGKEQIASVFDDAGRGAERAQSRITSAFKAAGATISSVANVAKSQLHEFAGKELGGSLGSQARGVLQLRDSITALAIAADKGTEIVGGLKDQIQKTALSSNQLQGDVTDAMRAFVDQTGDLDTARANMELYGRTATATGAAMKEIALVGVELKDKLNITDQAKAFAILAEQSKGGAIHMRDFAKQGSRILNVAASAGVTGEEGLREVGALSETYAKYVGGYGATKAARVATSVENTFASIAKKSAKLEAAGVKVEGRDRFDVLFDIIRKTGGNETKLREVFSQQAMRGILGLSNEYKRTGRFDTYEALRTRQVDATVLDHDFKARMTTGESKIKQTQIERAKFMDKYFGGIAEFGAAHVGTLQAGALGLGFLGRGMSMLGGGVGGKLGGALSAAGAQRVFVVNMPGGGLGGGPGGKGGLGGVGGVLAGGVLAAGLYGIEKWKQAGDERLDAVENAGVEINRHQLMLKQKAADRAKLVKQLEAGGMGHNMAVYNAERAQKPTNNIKIEIVDGKATVTEDDGTRSKVNLERRKAEGD